VLLPTIAICRHLVVLVVVCNLPNGRCGVGNLQRYSEISGYCCLDQLSNKVSINRNPLFSICLHVHVFTKMFYLVSTTGLEHIRKTSMSKILASAQIVHSKWYSPSPIKHMQIHAKRRLQVYRLLFLFSLKEQYPEFPILP